MVEVQDQRIRDAAIYATVFEQDLPDPFLQCDVTARDRLVLRSI
jgi:hypothetical protein